MKSSQFLVPLACSLALLTLAPVAGAEPTRQVVQLRDSPVATAGWITMGGGALLITGSAVMFSLAQHKESEQLLGAGAEHLGPRNREIERYHLAAQALLFTGAAAFATGLTLVLFSPKQEYRAKVVVGAGTLQLRGSF